MRGFLLDTNCISEPLRVAPDQRVVQWIDSIDEEMLYLSVLTIGELRKGACRLPSSSRRSQLERWLDELCLRFAGRVLSINIEIADRWGRISATAESNGKSLSSIDSLLAATALHHNLTIATRDTQDFVETQVPILNPWL